jgi:glycosidase
MSERFIWWRHGLFYQVYPCSPVGGNGDEVTDLQDIMDQLDDLIHLGADAMRREMPDRQRGDSDLVEDLPEDVIAYAHSSSGQRLLVVTNLSGNAHILDLSELGARAELLLSTHLTGFGSVDLVALPVKPNQSLLLRILCERSL